MQPRLNDVTFALYEAADPAIRPWMARAVRLDALVAEALEASRAAVAPPPAVPNAQGNLGHSLAIPSYSDPSKTRIVLNVNDTIDMGDDRKRWVVAAFKQAQTKGGDPVPVGILVALSGDPKAAATIANLSPGMHGGVVRKRRFPAPVFYGKQAAKLYKVYADVMAENGNGALIAPMQTALVKPDEPEEVAVADAVSEADADVVIRHTVQDGTTIDWKYGRDNPDNEELRRIARSGGFVWAHMAKQWRRTNSVGLVETRAPIARMVGEIRALGLTVYLDLQTGDTAEALARKAEYLEERAERTEERAERKRIEAGTQTGYAAQRAEEAITKAEIPGYFPTGRELAVRMAGLAEIHARETMLEPSAGHGALAQAMRDRAHRDIEGGGRSVIDVMEINPALRGLLQDQGFAVVAPDVMDPDFNPGEIYDRIVMNPPYEDAASIDHVRRVWEWLKPGGILVALLPESIWYRNDRKHSGFRAWFEGMDARDVQVYDVEAQSFGRAGSIKTRILKLKKPWKGSGTFGVPATMQGDPATLARIAAARAAVAGVASGGHWQASRDATAGIPLGQPVLVGHYSEGKHRRAVEKAQRAADKAAQTAEYAESLEEKAARLRRAAGRVDATAVSRGGRMGEAEEERKAAAAARLTATDTPDDSSLPWGERIKIRMRKVKKPTGAERAVLLGDRGGRVVYRLLWKGGGDVAIRFSRGGGDPYSRAGSGPPSVSLSHNMYYFDPPNLIVRQDLPSDDPDAMFRAAVDLIRQHIPAAAGHT